MLTATLLQLAATRSVRPLARAVTLTSVPAVQTLPGWRTATSTQQQQQQRTISSTPTLYKRKGGASAFVVKSSQYKKKGLKTKDKLKHDTAPHKTHLDAMRELKTRDSDARRSERAWDALEQDDELNRELDAAFAYLDNLGADGEYIYEPEPTLRDVDERDALAKLNALARGDADVVAEVEASVRDSAAVSTQLAVDDYNFLLRVYAIKGLVTEANALLTRMEQNVPHSPLAPLSSSPSPASPAAVSTAAVALTQELDAVPHRVAPNAHSYMYYVCALATQRDAAAAVQTLGRMKARGILPDVATYNSVMHACARANRVQWAYNLFEKLQVAGFAPDRASFTILMNAAIAENDVDRAFETFHLMRTHVIEPDVVAFTCLIHGFATVGRVEKALNLLEDLLESGLTPTAVTFHALMNACAKSHYYAHKAVEFYHEMQELYDYVPDLYTYNTVLHACAKIGDVVEAETIVGHMRKHHVPLDERTFNTILNVYARAQIKHIVAKAPRNHAAPAPPAPLYQRPLEWDDDGNEIDLTRPGKDVSSLANLNYDGAFEDEDEDEDEDEEENEDDEEEGDALTLAEQQQIDAMRREDDAAAVAVAPANDLVDASLHGVQSNDFELTPMALHDFAAFQTHNIARAEAHFAAMASSEPPVLPSVVTLNSMLHVYANALRLRSAEAFVANAFAQHDATPDKFTYRVLMHMYVRAKRTVQAEQLLETIKHLQRDGTIEADGVVFGLLVDLYARKRQLRRALVVLEDADAAGVQVQEKHLKKIRKLTEQFGVYTDLIPEDPNAVIFAGTRHKLMAKRKVRAQVLAYNTKVGKRYLLPDTV